METITIELNKEESNAVVFTLFAGGLQLDCVKMVGSASVGMPKEAQDTINKIIIDGSEVYKKLLAAIKDKWPIPVPQSTEEVKMEKV